VKPEIRYARNGGVAIAFAVVGDGPVDLVYVAPFGNLEIAWENPLFAQFLRRLATFARVVIIDRRGTGLSDRYASDDLPALEDLVDDVTVVLDAVGTERAALLGFSDAGALCAMFAAVHPERVSALILYATAARGTVAPDYPWQWSEDEWHEYLAEVGSGWGTPAYAEQSLAFFNPSLVGDERQLAWWGRHQRLSASPGAMLAQELVFREMDIRRMLPAIGVPTLVLHRTDDAIEPVEQGRYIADAIHGAQHVELPGRDHFPWAGDQAALVSEVQHFLSDVRAEDDSSFNRVLATVLFTDIADSTARSASMGDRDWGDVRQQHDRQARGQLARFRGREVKSLGDGFLAVFDGPARAVRCAEAISASVTRLGIEVRAGLHTGEVELEGNDVAGIAVAIGARIGALAAPGEVLVSSTVKDLVVGSGLSFADRGVHPLKGVPDEWRLYALASASKA
jgi:pimeloyl-ACP methyl ester carboxylesterase/class 3 adenylate cyclase